MSNHKGYTIKSLRAANSIARKANPKAYLFLILLSVLKASSTFIALASTEYTINSAYNLFAKKTAFIPVVWGILAFALAAILFSLIDMARKMTENRLMLDVTFSFWHGLYEQLGSICWDYYENHDTYLKIYEVRTKTLETIKKMITSIMTYITAVPLALIYIYYLFQINLIVVVIYLVLLVVFNGASSKMFRQLDTMWEQTRAYSQKQNYFFNMCGDKVTHQEFKFHRIFGYASRKWEELYNAEYHIRLKIFGKFEVTMQTARILFNIPYISMLLFAAYEIAIGKHEIGFLMLVNSLCNEIIDTFMTIQDQISNNRVDSRFIKSYHEICDLKHAPNPAEKVVHPDIDLNNISYTYPQAKTKSLDGLSLHIRAGEKIAVVGVNGSGKTTVTNLLLSLTKQFVGSITGDGSPVRLEQSVSCILQDFTQYQMTIRENIEVGFPRKRFTEDEILCILEKVGLKETVLALKKGMDTPLGQLEEGIELSKGQWQRLAIARLLANPNATIWILDEPTAYLDPLSEIQIYSMIHACAGERTVLFISHRLGFAKKADRIVLFDHGHIAEQGTHKKLIEVNGKYAQMYKIQEDWYTE